MFLAAKNLLRLPAVPRTGANFLNTGLASATGGGIASAILEGHVMNVLDSNTFNFRNIYQRASDEASPSNVPPPVATFGDAICSSTSFQDMVANIKVLNPQMLQMASLIQSESDHLETIPDKTSEEYKQLQKQLKVLEDALEEAVSGTLKNMKKELEALYDFATANARRLCGLEKEVADLQVAVQETKEQVKANTVKTTSNASNITNNTSSITNNASSNTSNAAAIRRNEQWLEQIDKDVQGDFQHQAYEDVVKSIDAEQLQLQVFEAAEMTFEAAEMIFVGQTAAMAAHQKEWAAHQKVMQVARIKMNAATQLCAAAKQNYDLLYGES